MPEHPLWRAVVRGSSPHAVRWPGKGLAQRNELQWHRGAPVGVSQPGLGRQQVHQGHHEVDQMFK